MKIEIRLFASLAPYGKTPLISPEGMMECKPPTTVADLVEALAVPQDEIKLVFLNGKHAGLDAAVKEGDRIGLFPPVGGG
ncbi:MoaD/ThiS family protein [Desulfosudis oleivorans]|uniref:ThiamineS protein n=1 Tax=Desulfosudis oleivorans (strain DSM 6200 / JCM 39069 / Hxd3) TaxID=96561 RepID=A8ZW73_DESOH|nr:MoaD/ThiS family protein [Desulfosudis oleivorans]ABW68307.1 thiamineS protein [Desulfosudis oleivorans Hxd3]